MIGKQWSGNMVNKCEHGISDDKECTACFAKSDLLLVTDYPPKKITLTDKEKAKKWDEHDFEYCNDKSNFKNLKKKFENLQKEILSLEPTDPEAIIQLQNFTRYDMENPCQ